MYVAGSWPGHLSFCGQNVPDWVGSAQAGAGTAQYITNLSLSLSLPLCSISPHSPSICLSQTLSPPFCISDYKCSQAQGQLHALYHISSTPPLSLWLTSLTVPLFVLYFFLVSYHHPFQFAICFLPSCSFPRSTCVGFPLLCCYTLSLSPSVLSTSQQSPGVKTCWHPLVWQVRLCVCMSSEEGGWLHYIVDSCSRVGVYTIAVLVSYKMSHNIREIPVSQL